MSHCHCTDRSTVSIAITVHRALASVRLTIETVKMASIYCIYYQSDLWLYVSNV